MYVVVYASKKEFNSYTSGVFVCVSEVEVKW